MKKYRLKQWYPGIPKNWKVGHEIIDTCPYYPTYVSCNELKPGKVNRLEAENNPEF
ncbi:MAG: hypothetical protein WD512_05570 [Candidatus Paceibacterota bacterium]